MRGYVPDILQYFMSWEPRVQNINPRLWFEWQNNAKDNYDDDYDKLIGRVKSQNNRSLVVQPEDMLRLNMCCLNNKGYSMIFYSHKTDMICNSVCVQFWPWMENIIGS